MRHHRIIKAVYKYTFRSEYRLPMAAALVRGNRIISFGVNQTNKSHPEQKAAPNWVSSKLPPIHAELDALIHTEYSLIEGSTIYIVRRRRIDDSYGLARPCDRCFSLLTEYGIRKIVYTINSQLGEENCFVEELI